MRSESLVRMGSGGRLTLPAELRKAIGVKAGDTLIIRLVDEGLVVTTPQQAIRSAQALVCKYVPAERLLANELLNERRDAAQGE